MQIRFKQLLPWCVVGQLLPLSASFAQSPTTIFSPVSTPASSIFGLSIFVLTVAAVIFAVVFSLLVYSIVRFRRRTDDDGREPPQVYGSNQLELAWPRRQGRSSDFTRQSRLPRNCRRCCDSPDGGQWRTRHANAGFRGKQGRNTHRQTNRRDRQWNPVLGKTPKYRRRTPALHSSGAGRSSPRS